MFTHSYQYYHLLGNQYRNKGLKQGGGVANTCILYESMMVHCPSNNPHPPPFTLLFRERKKLTLPNNKSKYKKIFWINVLTDYIFSDEFFSRIVSSRGGWNKTLGLTRKPGDPREPGNPKIQETRDRVNSKTMNEDMKYEQVRLETFSSWPANAKVSLIIIE